MFCKTTKITQINGEMTKICLLQVKGIMGMWVGTYDQFAFCNLKSLWTSLNCLFTFKTFCKALDVASNATKIAQINEGMSKICLLQMKGVMGMWVNTYDQFAFCSLKFLDVALLSLHFKNNFFYCLCTSKKNCTTLDGISIVFLNCSKQTKYEENMKFESKGV
jgi:hypothetical protein